MGQSPSSATCRASPTNAYWNNFSNPNLPEQSIGNATLLPAFLAYAIVGAVASVFNVICILVFLTKKEHRQKYLFYTLLAIGNLFNTVFMFLAGISRRQMIFTNQFNQVRSSFECLQQVAPHFQVIGGQLPALVILIVNVERFIAVYRYA
uniref:G-protein coupled receptors family 1 profile domain-containing protein n=1 Tax=Plectus sambesii TaxID=2011161 RepID=A0A914X308_9BILA